MSSPARSASPARPFLTAHPRHVAGVPQVRAISGLTRRRSVTPPAIDTPDLLGNLLRAAEALADREPDGPRLDTLWADLVSGRWRLLGHLGRPDGCYLVVAERTDASRRSLSPAEENVLRRAAEGAAGKEIALDSGQSLSTVATHLRRALWKLGLPSRRHLWMTRAFLRRDRADLSAASAGAPPIALGAYMTTFTRRGERIAVIASPAPRTTGGLTAAEREVTWLATSGSSNAEIAALRGVSPRTVANQLASAYRKLGPSPRRELALTLLPGSE